jgi:D-alanine--poly(phosphoribitol) ligase subunit 1
MYTYNLGLKFREVVNQQPERKAIVYDDQHYFSFRELDELSNAVWQHMIEQGVKKGNVVALLNTKQILSYASMLACLKAGFIYVNLDLKSPETRLKKIVETCDPSIVAYDHENYKILAGRLDRKIIRLTDIKTQVKRGKELPELRLVTEDHPAYIMFTSGSTGFPKGAVMSHRNILNMIEWAKEEHQITSNDRLTNVNPMYFDNSVFDFYASLFNGASMLPFDAETVQKPNEILKRIEAHKPSIWFSVPSMLVFLLTMRVLTPDNLKSIRTISFGGEGFPKARLRQLYDLYHKRIRILNVYGPTECTCICSAYDVNERDFYDMKNLAPLGKIAANFDYSLEKKNEKGIGELVLHGPQVGMGYYNDPDRTRKAFYENTDYPWHISNLSYKTGDLVKEKNGLLYFTGRKDNQIKHMGYRIELEEIEAAFSSLHYVDQVAVMYHKLNDSLGEILAFVSLLDKSKESNLKTDVAAILPSFMMPREIHHLEKLPKNNNGKIDKIQLKQNYNLL